MNRTIKTVAIVGGIGVIIYAIYSYYKKQFKLISDYDYKIIGVKIKSMTANNIVFDTKYRFFNKSKIEAEVNKIFLKVIVEGVEIGYITENDKFIIPAQGSSDIDLQISANPQLVFKNILSIALGGFKKKDINFTMDGYANIRSGFISTTLPIKYSDVISAYL
jgi:LEA14-like dessication related protein